MELKEIRIGKDNLSIEVMSMHKECFELSTTIEEAIAFELKQKNKTFILAYEEDILVGCISKIDRIGYILVGDLVVKKEYRHRGIGTRLLKEIMSYKKKLVLYATTAKSKDYYLQLGFTITKTIPKEYLEDSDIPNLESIEQVWELTYN